MSMIKSVVDFSYVYLKLCTVSKYLHKLKKYNIMLFFLNLRIGAKKTPKK